MTKNNTKTTLKNRILSGLLAVMMIAGIFGTWPITIFSEEPAAQNDAVYVSVASLGYASNQEALDAGEILYLNLVDLDEQLLGWGITKQGIVDENGNPLPNYLAYNDTRIFNTREGWANGNTNWEMCAADIWQYIGPGKPYAVYCEPGADYSNWIVIQKDNNANEPNYPDTDVWDGSVANSFGGGSGTAQDPYLIYTGAQLAYLASKTNSGTNYSGKYFKLMSDIDLNNVNWMPIGKGEYSNYAYAFRGSFDGKGHTIYGLSITSSTSSNVGLFGSLAGGATVQNLQICEGSIIVEQDGRNGSTSAGLLVGSMDGATIQNIVASGEVSVRTLYSGICSVALVAGYVYYDGTNVVTNVSAKGTASGYCSGYNSYVGGIVGVKNYSSGALKISNCVFYGTVKASDASERSYAGGILGISCGGETIQNSIFVGEIYSDDVRDAVSAYYIKEPSYSNCYYNANFTSTRGTAKETSYFQSQEWVQTNLGWDFENVWKLDGEYLTLKGFNGFGGGQAHTHTYTETQRENPTCGIGGYIRYTCSDCGAHYDEILPALDHAYSVSEVVEATCQKEGYTRYTCEHCLDYYDEAIAILRHKLDANNYCTMCGKYIDKPIADVWDGTADTSWYFSDKSEFTIVTAEQLAGFAQLVNRGYTFAGKTVYLGIDIDLSGYAWTPIGYGSNRFAGTFNGQGHVIDAMTVEGNYVSAGLFGRTYGAIIRNVGLTNVNINVTGNDGSHLEIGALIGSQEGGITSGCFMQGTVCARNSNGGGQLPIGGLIGNLISGELTDSYSVATVIGSGYTVQAGGLIGATGWYHNETVKITNCFSASTVSGTGSGYVRVGGFVGDNYTTYCTLTNCVVIACNVTSDKNAGTFYGYKQDGTLTLNNCYYSESNVNETFGAHYTSIENLKSKEWYESTLGWDFDNIWEFDHGEGFPGFGGSNGGNKCEHVYTETIVDPTCTTDGYTRYTCERCGYAYNGNYVLKYGHTVGEWIIDYEPTCTSSGRKHSECSVCGQQLENIYISSLGHSLVTVVTKEVTCTTPGVLTHTCERCGYNYSTYIYSEHAYAVSEQVQPTCYTDGYTLYICSKCQDTYTESIPGGHDYQSFISKVATSEEDGEITYTCEGCGDSYTQIIPAREAASVLLIQDKYPWSENNNVALLTQMLADGYITGWDITTTANFKNVDIGMYNVILIANDQTSATYSQLNYLGETLVQFATAGGVVIYGACDSGWGGGYINYSLPEGVIKKNFYSRYNYIVDTDHLIVSGVLTDGKALTNNLLYGNYCSHSAFETNSLPAGANVILQDAHGDATLVEYAVGDGHIILSGLTWEFYYNRNCYDGRTNTSYTKNVYDDLIVYALYLSDPCDHIYSEGEVVAPTCTEEGYTLHTCQNCGAKMKDEIVEATGHTEGEWQVSVEATQYEEGLKELRCVVCNEVLRSEVLPPVGGAAARVECESETIVIGGEVVFTFVVENCDPVTSLHIVPVFDTDIFEIVRVEWLLGDAVHQEIEEGTYISTSIWNEPININGAVYRIVLRVKQITNYPSIGFTLKIEDKENAVTVVPKVVEVTECKHTETRAEVIDDTYHAYVCVNCGHAVMAEHIFDDIYDVDCNECAHTRCLKGDVDNDGDVDVDDCIYLVYSVFFGTTDYPVYQDLDFDGDGVVGSEDGVYLLRYIYYGAGEYPLH